MAEVRKSRAKGGKRASKQGIRKRSKTTRRGRVRRTTTARTPTRAEAVSNAEGTRSAGGAAEAGGALFQNRVAAWYAARILTSRPPAADLAQLGASLRCQADEPVDDVVVRLEGGGSLFIQAKRSISLSGTSGSDFASVLDQFVRQFLKSRSAAASGGAANSALGPGRDRLLLAVSRRAPATVTVTLPSVLERVRSTSPGTRVDTSLISRADRDVWRSVRRHLVAAWKKVTGSAPTDSDLVAVVAVVRVVALDVDPGGRDEQASQELLSLTLRDSRHSALAWDKLVGACGQFAAERSGRDLSGLLAILGPLAKAPPAFADDAERLSVCTANALERLQDLSVLRVGSASLKIGRDVVPALVRAADEGSLVVVGEPGAGKSGALHDFVRAQQSAGRDVILLSADDLSGATVAALSREIGLTHDFDEVFANWPGDGPGFLVIDALDAVRGEPAAAAVRELIRRVLRVPSSRWRVIVSIRRFDLRYSVELREHFRGPPADVAFVDPDPGLRQVRHISIPELSPPELESAAAQSPVLQQVLEAASPALRALLRNAFNLRLACDLIGDNVSGRDLTGVSSGSDLLERYWLERVLRAPLGDDREAVLRRACEAMLAARQLKVERDLLRAGPSGALSDLLSTHVLAEWQPTEELPPERSTITFSHHVLYDYAVARLMFDLDVDRVVRALQSDTELALAARPSLVMFFQRLWFQAPSRVPFWSSVVALAGAAVPAVAKLVGSAVAAEGATRAADVAPLTVALRTDATRRPAEQTFAALIGAALDRSAGDHAVDVDCWSQLLWMASEALTPAAAWAMRLLLADLIARAPPGGEAAARLGETARRLLHFAWSEPVRNRFLTITAITSVCNTYSSDPSASASLLRRALTPESVRENGSIDLYWMAERAKRLAEADPQLTRDLYVAAFTYRETSRAQTSMGDSRILSLTSTKAQDYSMVLYQLAEAFPVFLEKAPDLALEAFVRALEFYINEDHRPSPEAFAAESFSFDGAPAVLRHDFSSIWDDGDVYAHDEPMKLFQAVEDRVSALAAEPEKRHELDLLIGKLISLAGWGALWRRLLLWGAEYPESIGLRLWSTLAAPQILTASETHYAAGELLKKIFASLSPSQRASVEQAIMAIPAGVDPEKREYAERIRNRLLGCLDRAAIITPDARSELARLDAAGSVPPNTPPHSPHRFVSRALPPYDYLREKGVPIDAPANVRIQELVRPLLAFRETLKSEPDERAVSGFVQDLKALLEALASAASSGVHPEQAEDARTTMADVAAAVCAWAGLSSTPQLGALLKDVLLQASTSERPRASELSEDSKRFSSPSWGNAPRISAAEGLMKLAGNPSAYDESLREALRRLALDPVPAVRFQIARGLALLWDVDRELMRELAGQFVRDEPTAGVLSAVVSGALVPVARADPSWSGTLLADLFERLKTFPEPGDALESCLSGVAGLDLWFGDERCRRVVTELISGLPGTASHLKAVIGSLRDYIVVGSTDAPEPRADVARLRTLAIIHSSLEAALAYWHRLGPSEFQSEDEKLLAQIRGVATLFDTVAHEFFFAAGGASDDGSPSREQLERMYSEAGPALEALSRSPIASASHYLLQTLEKFIPLDPAGTFLRIARVVAESTKTGYQFESAGAELAVRLVERYLADHFSVLRSRAECRRALVDILDVFAGVGWPSARQLTYRLQDIYR